MESKLTSIRPVWLLVLVASATGLLVYSLGNYHAPSFIKYLTYSYSTLVLIIACANLPRFIHYCAHRIRTSWLYLKVRTLLFSIPPLRRYLTDAKLKHQVDLGLSVITNFSFNIFRLGNGFMRGAVWEISLALYYLFLVVLKTVLLWNFRCYDQEGEHKIYRRNGFLLLGLALLLVGMVTQMVIHPTGKSYDSNYMIYLVAIYSFYLIISAIIGMIKYRRNKSPTLKVIKNINLITASVSLLMLQTTMLATFGGDEIIAARMNGLTGAVVVLLILIMSINALRKANSRPTKTAML